MAWGKDYVSGVLENKDLIAEQRSGSLDVSDVYVSAKVPFAYDYADDCSAWFDKVKAVAAANGFGDLSRFKEVVFCGFGEPTVRLYDLLDVARYIKSKSNIKIRINTNGLADLIWNKSTASELKGLIDTVSVSLNATNKEDYLKVVRPRFGIESFDAMLKFTKECTEYVPSVMMTVVDVVTTKDEQEACRKICESVGAIFRVRPYSD